MSDARNFAPGDGTASMALPEPVPQLVRLSAAAVGLVLVGGSMAVARRANGMPMAALLGTAAMLLIPGTLWYHYLALLLPFAAMAWPRASTPERSGLLIGVVMTSTGLLSAGIVSGLVGAVIILVVAGLAIWRMTTTEAPYLRLDDDAPTAQIAGTT